MSEMIAQLSPKGLKLGGNDFFTSSARCTSRAYIGFESDVTWAKLQRDQTAVRG